MCQTNVTAGERQARWLKSVKIKVKITQYLPKDMEGLIPSNESQVGRVKLQYGFIENRFKKNAIIRKQMCHNLIFFFA